MIYKWVRRLLLLLVLVSLGCVLALTAGWMGIQHTAFVFQWVMVTTGVFVFYHTRREKVSRSWLVWPVMAAHFLVLPLTLLMVMAVKNESLALQYWFSINLGMLLCMGVAWLLLLGNLPLPVMVRTLLLLVSMVYLVLLGLHMGGVFANGKIIFFSGILLFLGTVVLVFMGIRKPPVPETPAPTAEPGA